MQPFNGENKTPTQDGYPGREPWWEMSRTLRCENPELEWQKPTQENEKRRRGLNQKNKALATTTRTNGKFTSWAAKWGADRWEQAGNKNLGRAELEQEPRTKISEENPPQKEHDIRSTTKLKGEYNSTLEM
jgi:hypothetical protein